MFKKKKKSDSHQPVIDLTNNSDTDYIVFESDDISSYRYSSEESSESSESESESESESSESESESSESEESEESESDIPTLVINIRKTFVHRVITSKRVRFNKDVVTHVVEIEDRKGYWVEDKFRFQQRCASIRDAISFVFDEMHRRKMRLIVNLSDILRGVITTYEITSTKHYNILSSKNRPIYSKGA